MNRRDFLKTAALTAGGFAASSIIPTFARAAAASRNLAIDTRTLEVNRKATTVYSLTENGRPGLTFAPGERFSVALENKLKEETIIHWHGLAPPWEQDGVPDNPRPMLKADETRAYYFALDEPGTYWMHAHTLQEQNLLAAPLIVHSPEDLAADRQEVVLLLHDFSFEPAEALLARLNGGQPTHMTKDSAASTMPGMGGMHSGSMGHGMSGMGGMGGMSGMGGMGNGMSGMMSGMAGHGAMDLNDIDYDAYLANDRTLDDPEVVRVNKGGRIRLRIINAAASTAFHIQTGSLAARLVAVDGRAVQPISGRSVPITMGQRLDLDLDIPGDGGAFPILALREGARDRTGIVLATQGATIARLPTLSDDEASPLDLGLEAALRAIKPLPERAASTELMAHLMGNMATYQWAIGGLDGVRLTGGERVEITMMNMSMMAHPMHLHGHTFQVVAIGGQRFAGALRDTVLVPPMQAATIAFDAGKPGHWPFHCHHLYHMVTGMMTHLEVV